MNRLAVGVITGVCFLVLIGALASLPATGTHAQGRGNSPMDVTVVNTPAVNAQQSGAWNVGLAGTPTINAQQSGSWNVDVHGLSNRQTTSSRITVFSGETSSEATFGVPECPAGTAFLVTDVQAGLEVRHGHTRIDVVQLGRWAVKVPLFQFDGSVGNQVALTALGNGPEAISASIPGGQQVASGFPLIVSVAMLGDAPSTARHEFLVHVTGFCGVPFEG